MKDLRSRPAGNPGNHREITPIHYSYVIEQLKTAMLDAGIQPPDLIIGDGVLHRFKIDGRLNGAYVLHLDGKPSGYFEDFKQGIKQKWTLSGNLVFFPDFQLQGIQEKQKQRQKEKLAKQSSAATKAVSIWRNAKPAPENHPYLVRKRIKPHGARLGRESTLIIPLYNKHGELVNLQFISESGEKRFLSGGLKKGCFYWIGHPKKAARKVLISEGFATGASLNEDTSCSTVIAFDAGNLQEVAINIRSLAPCAEIIICADNDASGKGEEKAIEAALAVGGSYIMPPTVGMDFNDFVNGGISPLANSANLLICEGLASTAMVGGGCYVS